MSPRGAPIGSLVLGYVMGCVSVGCPKEAWSWGACCPHVPKVPGALCSRSEPIPAAAERVERVAPGPLPAPPGPSAPAPLPPGTAPGPGRCARPERPYK